MISVIIPIYNASAYLPCMIRCLQAQTTSDFEVLLINDGSTDDSGQICHEVAELDPRFRVISQANGGVSSARNRGIQSAAGDYVAFLDADDEIPPNYLEQLLKALTEHSAPVAVCDVAIISDAQETARFTCESGVLSQCQALNYLLSRRKINSGPCAKLFRRDILSGLTFPPLRVYEDILFVVEALCRCDCVAVTNQTEYRYLQNSSSAMGAIFRMPSMDIVEATSRLLEFIQCHPELDPACLYITISHLMQYVQSIIDNCGQDAREFIRAACRLTRNCTLRILKCPAFPQKEKAVFILFASGWLYHKRKIYKV